MAVALGAGCIYYATALAAPAGAPSPAARQHSSPFDPTLPSARWFAGRRSIVSTPGDTRAPAIDPPAALTDLHRHHPQEQNPQRAEEDRLRKHVLSFAPRVKT